MVIKELNNIQDFKIQKCILENKKKGEKENEKKTIRFSAQYHAMTFYEMLGYTKDNDDIFVEVGIEHISMSKIV